MESNVSTIRIHMTTWLMDSQDIFRKKRSMLRTVEDFEANIGIVKLLIYQREYFNL